jgi:hypothetical protein
MLEHGVAMANCAICGDPEGDMHNVAQLEIGASQVNSVHRFMPTRPKYWTAAEMVDWLKTHTRLEDPEYAARWWLGCMWVEGFNDMNLRERTELIVDGSEAITLEDVTGYLQQTYNEDCETVAEGDSNLELDWLAFWRDQLGGTNGS